MSTAERCAPGSEAPRYVYASKDRHTWLSCVPRRPRDARRAGAVVAHWLAGGLIPAVLAARTAGRDPAHRRWLRGAARSVPSVRGGGAGHTGSDGTAKPAGRRRALPIRPQPDIPCHARGPYCQALLLWQPVLVGYAAMVATVAVAFVREHEEPTLRRKFGDQYDTYRQAVPGWWPRRRPWRPEAMTVHTGE